jgi:hypothetical protein
MINLFFSLVNRADLKVSLALDEIMTASWSPIWSESSLSDCL